MSVVYTAEKLVALSRGLEASGVPNETGKPADSHELLVFRAGFEW